MSKKVYSDCTPYTVIVRTVPSASAPPLPPVSQPASASRHFCAHTRTCGVKCCTCPAFLLLFRIFFMLSPRLLSAQSVTDISPFTCCRRKKDYTRPWTYSQTAAEEDRRTTAAAVRHLSYNLSKSQPFCVRKITKQGGRWSCLRICELQGDASLLA